MLLKKDWKKNEYIAVLVKGMKCMLWFESAKVTIDDTMGTFEGVDGWGRGGSPTDLICEQKHIEVVVHSDSLQYTD